MGHQGHFPPKASLKGEQRNNQPILPLYVPFFCVCNKDMRLGRVYDPERSLKGRGEGIDPSD